MTEHTDPGYLKGQEYSDAGAMDRRNEIQETYSNHPQDWFEWVFDQIRPVPRARVLELGGGSGALWRRNMLRKGPAQWIGSWEIYMTDLSWGMVTASRSEEGCEDLPPLPFDAARRRPSCPPYASLATDVQALPFKSASFDMVVAIGLFDHVPNLGQAFAEVRRVLRPTGRLYASAGGVDHLEELENLVQPYAPDARLGGAPERFGLENGARLLAPYFTRVELNHYPGNLEFQTIEPVMEYALSEGVVRSEMDPHKLQAFRADLERLLAEDGRLRVKVRKGLFAAFNSVTGSLSPNGPR